MHLLYKKITLRQFTYSLWEKIQVPFDITVFCNPVTIEGGVVLFLYGTILEHLVLLDYLLIDVWKTVNEQFCFAAIQIYNTSWKPSGPPKMSQGNKTGFYAINSKLQWVYMDSTLKMKIMTILIVQEPWKCLCSHCLYLGHQLLWFFGHRVTKYKNFIFE